MPTFNRKTSTDDAGEWFIRKNTANLSNAPPVSTFQIAVDGRDMLLDLDLNHSSKPHRKADIDDDLFYLLNDLGLLSKKGDGPDPSAALSGSPAFKRLDGLSATQRAKLARALLTRFTLRELCERERVFQFLTALEALPEDDRLTVLRPILTETPFDAAVINDPAGAIDTYADSSFADDAEFYNPILLALILHFLYEAWGSPDAYNSLLSSREGTPIWVWDGWVAFTGSELMFYLEQDEAFASFPESIQEAVVEQTRFPAMGELFEFLEHELSALATAQTVAAMDDVTHGLGHIARHGFAAAPYGHCLILPRPGNHDAPLPREALAEAETEAFNSKLAASLHRAAQQVSDN